MTPYDFAITLVIRLMAHGHKAYLVGGYVRDMLIKRESHDIDVATSATPDEVAAIFPNSERVGAKFGVTLVKSEGVAVEVATFRMDGAYKDARRPESVEFTRDFGEDVRRRDFTMNGLGAGLVHTGNQFRIIDLVGGQADIQNKLIRAIGDPNTRFQEDALRMLRAVRFAVQLGFDIEGGEGFTGATSTYYAIRHNAALIRKISPERVRDELSKILTSGHARRGIELLHELYLLDFIMPEVINMIGVEQNPLHHPEGDVWVHTLRLLEGLQKDCSVTLALGTLLHDVGKPGTAGVKDGQPTFYEHEDLGKRMTVGILGRLRYPNDVIMTVSTLVAEHMRFRLVGEMRRSKLLRFIGQPNFDELMELHRLDSMAGRGNLEHYELTKKVLAETPPEVLKPERLVTGEDLVGIGWKPGPGFRIFLDFVAEQQLEGAITTREQALAVAGGFTSDSPKWVDPRKECSSAQVNLFDSNDKYFDSNGNPIVTPVTPEYQTLLASIEPILQKYDVTMLGRALIVRRKEP